MHLSRLRVLSAAVVPLLFLAGCGSKSDQPASALDVITVAGTAKAPTLTLKTKPVTVKATTTKVVTAGKGAKTTTAKPVIFNYALFNGKDGKQIDSSFGKNVAGVDLLSQTVLPGLIKGMVGQQVGSRVLIAIPPAEAFGAEGNPQAKVGAADTVVFLVDFVSEVTPLPAATGTAVASPAGLPTVTVDGAKAAKVKVPKAPAPPKLVVQPLIKGAGAVVKAGQTIRVNYTGVLWKDGKQFDASGDKGAPLVTQIGAGQVIAGWDKGLVGKTVGSRILLVVPPVDGYGAKGSPPLIGAKDTLVFVVDILSAV